MLRAGRARSGGVATVEFHIVALFALLPLCLGTLQLALLMSDNHHIDHAAFLAARRAAMSGGGIESARQAFAQASSLLLVDAASELDAGNVAGRVASAQVLALTDQARFARFRIVSPGVEAQADFALPRGDGRVIPNDGLEYRSRIAGQRSGLTLQQANILHLEVSWCRPLIVPFARELLLGTLRAFDLDPWRQYCYSEGRVPIRSEGITPMQSDFRVSS
ncbi:MAG TPA: TadE/TadG family type IV pilus assembly protein [Steroidobacteraceae bacterium]|nr:TadE/TadG family type IV pilus assembly protein [Steroidobacteraceae bacterium]